MRKNITMPAETVCFSLEMTLSTDEIKRIKAGCQPRQMEDKWLVYEQDGLLFVHRSWSGYCLYQIELEKSGKIVVTANRDPQQHPAASIESDRLMVQILLNSLAGRQGENAALMKQYLKLRQELEQHTTFPQPD